MGKQDKIKLVNAYRKYRKSKKMDNMGIFRSFMPEIIFRTTKLEGEKVTRKMISALFR